MGVGISQKNLAKRLGLSRATVSYALNGKAAENRVPPETVERVLQAVRETGYVPNKLARSLQQRRTGVIGISIGDFRMDWTHRLYQGVSEALADTDAVPLFAVRGLDPERERGELQWMLERRADGIIVTNPMQANSELYRDIVSKNVPLLFVSEVPRGMHREFPYVLWDSPRALAAMVDQLVQTGRRRFAWIGCDYQEVVSLARFHAFEQVMRFHDIHVPEDRIFHFPLTRFGFEADLTTWIRDHIVNHPQPVEVVVCLNDETASSIMPQIAAQGLRIPADVVVTGVGNLPIPGSAFDQIVTVREPLREFGQTATRALLGMIEDQQTNPIKEVIDSVEIHDRSGVLGPKASDTLKTSHLPTLKSTLEGETSR